MYTLAAYDSRQQVTINGMFAFTMLFFTRLVTTASEGGLCSTSITYLLHATCHGYRASEAQRATRGGASARSFSMKLRRDL